MIFWTELMAYKQYVFSFIICWMLVLPQVQAQTSGFDQLKVKFDSGKVFSATFTHVFTDSYTGESLTSEGSIWIAKESYKLISDEQVLIVDGKSSMVYDQNRNRVIISDYLEEEDEFAPSKMLQGADSSYTVTEVIHSNGRRTITLRTEDDFAPYSMVTILLDQQSNPSIITAVDFAENEIKTHFKNGSFIEVSVKLFELQYPDDAEIVDTRY